MTKIQSVTTRLLTACDVRLPLALALDTNLTAFDKIQYTTTFFGLELDKIPGVFIEICQDLSRFKLFC